MATNKTGGGRQFSYSLGSEDLFDLLCQPCQLDGHLHEIVGMCTDCQEGLCQKCYDAHTLPTPSRNHKLLDKMQMLASQIPIKKIDKCSEKCALHGNKTIKYYCINHCHLGCRVCITVDHRSCTRVRYIPHEANELDKNEEYIQAEGQLKSIVGMCKNITDDYKNKFESLETDCSEAVTLIQEFRKDMTTILGMVEADLLNSCETLKSMEIESMAENVNSCKVVTKELHELIAEKERYESNQQNCDLYILMMKTKGQLNAADVKLKEVEKEQSSVKSRMRFIANKETLNTLKQPDTFGQITKTGTFSVVGSGKTRISSGLVSVKAETSSDLRSEKAETLSALSLERIATSCTLNSEKTETPIAPRLEKTETPIAPRSEKTETPSTPRSEQTEAPRAPHSEKTETPIAPRSEKTETPIAPRSEKTETPSTPRSEKTEPPSAPHSEKAETPFAPRSRKTETPSTPRSEKTEPPFAPRSEKTETPFAPRSEKTETPSTPRSEKTEPPSAQRSEKTETPSAPRSEKTGTLNALNSKKLTTRFIHLQPMSFFMKKEDTGTSIDLRSEKIETPRTLNSAKTGKPSPLYSEKTGIPIVPCSEKTGKSNVQSSEKTGTSTALSSRITDTPSALSSEKTEISSAQSSDKPETSISEKTRTSSVQCLEKTGILSVLSSRNIESPCSLSSDKKETSSAQKSSEKTGTLSAHSLGKTGTPSAQSSEKTKKAITPSSDKTGTTCEQYSEKSGSSSSLSSEKTGTSSALNSEKIGTSRALSFEKTETATTPSSEKAVTPRKQKSEKSGSSSVLRSGKTGTPSIFSSDERRTPNTLSSDETGPSSTLSSGTMRTSVIQDGLISAVETKTILRAEYVKDVNVKYRRDKICNITGLVVLPGSRLVVIDCSEYCGYFGNGKIKLVNIRHGQIITHLPLLSTPWGAAMITNNQVAVTLPNQEKVAIVNIADTTMAVDRTLGVNGKCRGVDCRDSKLAVLFVNPHIVQVLTLQGEVLFTITNDESGTDLLNDPVDVAFGHDNTSLYVSNSKSHNVVHVKFDGTIVDFYEDNELRCPQALLTDSSGNVYVCGETSHNIHQFTPDCRKAQVLLRQTDDLFRPCSIAFSEAENRLYVGMFCCNQIKVYRVVLGSN